MMSSASHHLRGFVLDANVLSLLARSRRLDLLQHFALLPLYITPTIYRELEVGVERGVAYLADILELIVSDSIGVIAPEVAETQAMNRLPAILGAGEAEAIVICQRRGMVFITHDRKAANYCDRVGIACVRLKILLSELQKADLLPAAEVRRILS